MNFRYVIYHSPEWYALDRHWVTWEVIDVYDVQIAKMVWSIL